MKIYFQYLLAAVMVALLSLNLQAVTVEKGVSRALAQYRSKNLSGISYSLTFTVPDSKQEPVSFFETLRFLWRGDEDLQIDFQGDADQLDGSIMVNGKHVRTELRDEHIIIPQRYLKLGENKVLIGGYSGDQALNRHEDYMYTLFVPDHARSAFPCFDQPDLKATFNLELELPAGWVSISNNTEKPIPTYLFSFTAGKFQVQTVTRGDYTLTGLYRETDPDKVAQLPIVFDQVTLSLRWMEGYTGLKYPFEHYGFVVLPGYQFGGMEHPGCIQFTDHEIFLGANPTPDEEMTRLNLIAHETAHMWFGDLVTMRWFDDVWTKEVFANFMADKISRQQFPDVNHDLAFIKTHYPLALNTDRTAGTHPIQQPLDNLNQAGLLYGNIIYHKAPIMMRKLEQEKGYIDLREGLRSYLLKYAYGNATWDDLIAELDKYAPEHSARSFSDVWVKQKGLPTVTCEREENGSLLITQQDPYSRGLAWKQAFEVGYLVDGRLTGSDDVYMYDRTVAIDVPEDAVPILNLGGDGYGRFAMSEQALSVLSRFAVFLSDEKCRYAAVMNLYENYHLGNISADALLETLLTILGQETNELIASTVCSDIAALCSRIEDSQRPALEQRLLEMAQSHGLQSVRQTLLRHLGTTAVSPMVVEWLYDIWQNQGSQLLNQRDYTRMAYHLALMRPDTWQQILDTQRTRLKTDDERNEFDFVSRACDPDEAVQQQLFEALLKVENRRVEPWARTMLALLNDPTREPFSNRYLEPGLDAIEEIQRTGDIFFPGYWLSSLLGGHRSNEAREIVQTWINGHTSLMPALMNKVNENAYWLLKR